MKKIILLLVLSLLNSSYAAMEEFGRLTTATGKKYIINYDGAQKPGMLEICSPNGKAVGYYRVVDRPDRIDGHRIMFDRYADVDGNVIAFKDDPPREIELDTAQVVLQPGSAPNVPNIGKKLPDIDRKVPDIGKEVAARKRLVSKDWKRVVESFNQGWIFALADETKGELAGQIPPARWRRVDLPHDWGVEHPVNEGYLSGSSGGFTKTGLGWYRKSFTLSNDWKDRRVYVDFGGVFMNSDVWINGNWLGNRPYGFSSFRYDLTPYLNFGEPNEIKVRVDNSRPRSARWYTGSGIYRDVNLVVLDPVHIGHWGTYVQTQGSTANLKTTVVNSSDKARKITVRSTVAGQAVETVETIPPLGQKEVFQTLKVAKLKLWSAEEPNLYTVETKIVAGGKSLDQYATSLGFRTIEFDAKKGLFVNGESTKLKGVCIHEDGGGAVGATVPVDVWERRFNILKKMGCNAVRCSHNPFFPEFYDLADRMGMYVIDEAFDEWRIGKREHAYFEYFNEWAERDLTDMIRRDRNHPSIICWSIGNEIRDVHEEHGGKTAKWLTDICHSLDSRPTTIGLNHFKHANEYGVTEAVDWVGYNFAHRDNKYSGEHAKYPDRKIYGSETTHSLQTRGVYLTQTFRKNTALQPNLTDKEIFTFPDSYNSSYDNGFVEHHNRFSLAHMRDNDWLAGEFRWTGIDYLGESGPWPARFKSFGIIDMCGFPKDTYYLYQSVWADATVLHILPHWNWPGMEGVEIPVWIYANQCDEVELFVNGNSLGKKEFDYQKLYLSWNVAYAPGELQAISYKAGEKVKETVIKTAADPASIELVADKTEIAPNHRDVVHAQVHILDADGNFVPMAGNRVKFSVDGPAKILGVDNGDPLDHDPLKADNRRAFHGMCLALIQSGFETGEVTLHAESEGLKGATCKIIVQGGVPTFSHRYMVPADIGYELSTFELKLNVPQQKVEEPKRAKRKKKPAAKAPKTQVAPSTANKHFLRVNDAASATCGWKEARDNLAISDAPMKIGGKGFKYGIGTHSPSEIFFDLTGELAGFKRLTGVAGPDAKEKERWIFRSSWMEKSRSTAGRFPVSVASL